MNGIFVNEILIKESQPSSSLIVSHFDDKRYFHKQMDACGTNDNAVSLDQFASSAEKYQLRKKTQEVEEAP